MRILEVLKEVKEQIQVINYGGGLYVMNYPTYYNDGTPMTIAIKIENETEVVLERGEEVENMGLLSTSDEYSIMDLGSVAERYANVEGVDDIIRNLCTKYHMNYDKGIISIDADVDSTLVKLNRFIKCLCAIELKVEEKGNFAYNDNQESKTYGASEELMAYLNKKGN